MTIIFSWSWVTFVCLSIYKRILLGYGYPAYIDLINDLFLVAIIFLLSINRQSTVLRNLQRLAAFCMIIYQWADICVILAINNRLTWDNFVANYRYLDVIPYFISPQLILITLLVFLSLLILTRFPLQLTVESSSVNIVGGQVFFILFIAYLVIGNANNLNSPNSNVLNLSNTAVSEKTVDLKTFETIQKQYPELMTKIDQVFKGVLFKNMPSQNMPKPNIIIVVSESLSGVDSQYAGGLFERLPNIDKIQKEGTAFKMATANGKITAHGLSSLLLGTQPLKTGGYEAIEQQFPVDKFSANNIIAYAKKAGYKTIIISPGQAKNWNGLGNWFEKLGFDEIYDREDPVFKEAPRFTWNAPSDAFMYRFAEKLITHQKKPYLLLIETVSLHQPYILPDPKYRITSSALLNQIHYVDDTTYEFYQHLKQTGFLNQGIFMLFGDHRRFESLEKAELENGGYAVWHERIVATIVGHGVSPNTFCTYPFNLSDMNRLLHFIINGETINDNTLLNANLATQLGTNVPFSISLADEVNGGYLIRSQTYPPLYFSIFGNTWLDKIPYDAYKVAAIYLMANYQRTNQLLVP